MKLLKASKKAAFTSYHNLDKKGGNRRLWLEGEPLLRAGFMPGDFYDITLNIDTLAVELHHIPDSPEARKLHRTKKIRKVSRRQMSGWVKPIVDICNADITGLFGEFARFRAQAFEGRICFSIHPEDFKQAQRENRFNHHLDIGELTKGDAFLGLGISSNGNKTGFANKGIKTKQKWAVEIEARYLDVAAKNDPEGYRDAHLFCGSVEEVEKDLLDPVDIFSFSMECTNHSTHGKTKKKLETAEDGDGVTSLFGVVSMIHATNPAVLISENVPRAQNSASYKLLLKELERLGYDCHEMILDQSHSGAIDRRKRYWFVAYSRGLNINVDTLTPQPRARVNETFGEIMENVTDPDAWHNIEKLQKREAINKENGRNFSVTLVDEKSTKMTTIPRNYTKHQVSNPHVTDHNGHYRLLTKGEHAGVKCVPPRLVEHCAATTAHEGLGQGIAYFHAVGVVEAFIDSIVRPQQQLLLS